MLSRRQSLKLGAMSLCAPFIASRAFAAPLTLRFGNELPVGSLLNVVLAQTAKKIAEDSNNEVQLQIFPAAQLGGGPELLSQLRSGALDFYSPSGAVLSTMMPVAAINNIGFVFSDMKQVWAAMDGELGALVRTTFEKSPLYLFEKPWDCGFRQITTGNKPVTQASDLTGLKLRVPPSPLYTSMFSALGAAPTPIPFAEAYTALQTKIVDGQENPYQVIFDSKFYEVQRYVAQSNHMWEAYWVTTNRRKWLALPNDTREVLTKNFNNFAFVHRDETAKADLSIVDGLKAKGMQVTQVDTASFRKVLQDKGFYSTWRQTYGADAWKTLERYSGQMS